MTVRLRAHHLLCMLTYVGKGYSAAFTENFDRICERLGQGEDILLVDGPDDICAPLLTGSDPHSFDPHCFEQSVIERDAAARAAMAHLSGIATASGAHVTLGAELLTQWRTAFRAGTTRTACQSCEWHDLCTEIADSNFPQVRLRAVRLRAD